MDFSILKLICCLGIVARTRACTAWKVAVAASEFLTNVGDLNFKQIDVGKKRLSKYPLFETAQSMHMKRYHNSICRDGTKVSFASNTLAYPYAMSLLYCAHYLEYLV